MAKGKDLEAELTAAISSFLEDDTHISARSLADHIGVAPSTITRNVKRAEQVEAGKREQDRLRRLIAKADKSSKPALMARVAARDRKIADLEYKVQILTASHRAMLMALGVEGGIPRWKKFFEKYTAIVDELRELGALPAEVGI
jgi:IS30 family transposase